MKKFLLIITGLIVLLVVGTGVTILYTSVPLKAVSKLLSAMKVETEGMSGSLASGVNIEKMSFGSSENLFVLEKFSFKYSGLWDYFVKKEISISEITVGKMLIKVQLKSTKNTTSPNPTATQAEAGPGHQIDFNLSRKIHIAKIDIRNVRIDSNLLKEPFQLDQWLIEAFSYENKKLEFTKFEVNSNALDLTLERSLADLAANETPTSTIKSIKVVVKPTYFKLLKAPVSFEGSIRIDDGKFDKSAFHLAAFDNKVSLKFNESDLLVFLINDLNLSDYFNEIPGPIKRISLNAALGPEVTDISTFRITQGTFNLGARMFRFLAEDSSAKFDDFSKGILVHIAALSDERLMKINAQFSHTITSTSNHDAAVSDIPLRLELSSDLKTTEDDLLSELLFLKNYRTLIIAEKQDLNANRSYFIFTQPTAHTAVIAKREFTKDGVAYVEETTKDANGSLTKFTHPKTRQEKQTTSISTDAARNVTSAVKSYDPGLTTKISITQSKQQVEANGKAMGGLYEALAMCRPFESSMRHPMMANFTIKMQVHGVSEGKCKFTQTMPNGGLQTCLFTDQQRKGLDDPTGKALQTLMQDERVCKITGY